MSSRLDSEVGVYIFITKLLSDNKREMKRKFKITIIKRRVGKVRDKMLFYNILWEYD